MVNQAALWWGLVFGSIGLGYLMYGRRQRAITPTLCGIGLMIFPWFVSGTWALVLIGAVLLVVPFLFHF